MVELKLELEREGKEEVRGERLEEWLGGGRKVVSQAERQQVTKGEGEGEGE